MHLTIEQIRKLYPHPRSAAVELHSPPLDDEYCVGGALCQAVGMENHFPDYHRIAQALSTLNETLNKGAAQLYAMEIIATNDTGDFEAAWQLADQAIKAGGESKK